MSHHPAWTPDWLRAQPASLGGIFAHAQFSDHVDGTVQGLDTWLRLDRGMGPADAYQQMRTLITDDTLQVSADVTFANVKRTVHYIDVSTMLDLNL